MNNDGGNDNTRRFWDPEWVLEHPEWEFEELPDIYDTHMCLTVNEMSHEDFRRLALAIEVSIPCTNVLVNEPVITFDMSGDFNPLIDEIVENYHDSGKITVTWRRNNHSFFFLS